MLIKNVNIYTEEKKFVPGMIVIKDGQIEAVLDENAHVDTASQEEILDGKGNYAIPGLIDLLSTDAKDMIFVTVQWKRLKQSHSMRRLSVSQQSVRQR